MEDKTYVLQKLCQQISLSDTAKTNIVRQYKALGELISGSELICYDVDIKPQGSYNLGTAIKPLNGTDDDFDIDLVAIIHGKLDPKETKLSIGQILKLSKMYSQKLLPEKKRAWTVEYSNSHVDVVPSVEDVDADISVTNKIQENYEYRKSSPFKFKDWFIGKGQEIYQVANERALDSRAEVEEPEKYDKYTILQQVVQLLKYHRNKMFENRPSEDKPISMVITILAAQAYSGQDNLSVALEQVATGLRSQIEYDSDGKPHILNPINSDENFTDKWVEHPERAKAFFEWLSSVERDLGMIEQVEMLSWRDTLSKVYGDHRTRNAFAALGEYRSKEQREGNVSVSSQGVFGGKRSDKKVRQNTFWGD